MLQQKKKKKKKRRKRKKKWTWEVVWICSEEEKRAMETIRLVSLLLLTKCFISRPTIFQKDSFVNELRFILLLLDLARGFDWRGSKAYLLRTISFML